MVPEIEINVSESEAITEIGNTDFLFQDMNIVDDNLKTTSVLFSIAIDFSLLSCEFDKFTFKLLYRVILCC